VKNITAFGRQRHPVSFRPLAAEKCVSNPAI
jgi:hypothetical protein